MYQTIHLHLPKNNWLQFLLDHMECIISVEGTYGNVRGFTSPVVTSLVFKTSKGRTSPTFGATKFVFEDNGRQIASFHGRSGTAFDSIGAHFVPLRPLIHKMWSVVFRERFTNFMLKSIDKEKKKPFKFSTGIKQK